MKSPSKLINASRQRNARTANDAVTHSTSLNNVLDLFFISGASRTMSEPQICKMLEKAWAEDPKLTLRTIFWAGDIRTGQGERRFFRIAMEWLKKNYSKTFFKNFKLVPHFNRWDSLFSFYDKKVLNFIYDALVKEKNGLCAKWMPRKKQYNNFASFFRNEFKLGFKEYRKLIVELSNTVEQKMCAKEWKKIKYNSVPSVAFNKYRDAFLKNDEKRFRAFLEDVKKGNSTINAGAIFPHDIYKSFTSGKDRESIDLQWGSLPNYLEGTETRMIPVCDVSGSMHGDPMNISVALGVYLSERNAGIFKDAFITFSEKPTVEYLTGTASQRFAQLERASWGFTTNLSAVFDLILTKATEEKISESEMPNTILVISDMEFNSCGRLTNYDNIVNKYTQAGYKTPNVVFWNVNGRAGNVPVSAKQKGVALVSGCSPSIVKNVISGKSFTPTDIMLEVLNNKIYNVVKV